MLISCLGIFVNFLTYISRHTTVLCVVVVSEMLVHQNTHVHHTPFDGTVSLYLIIVHGDIKFVIKFESQAPYDSSKPQTVVGVHRLCLRCNVQDVFALIQGTDILTYTTDTITAYLATVGGIMLSALIVTMMRQIRVTSVCDQKDSILIQSLCSLQSHLIAKLLNDIYSHLK